ncbi:MAG: hypothetical protein JWM05_1612 [Acidimicrobiales bacterium]|nr:hypothetical protein [Acidimicrobiales bacterium]
MHTTTAASKGRISAIRVAAAAVLVLLASAAAPAGAAPRVAVISAHMAVNKVQLGQTAYVVGNVTPAGATPRVVVQRDLGGGRWSDRNAGPVASNGSFKIGIRPSQAGIYALRVRSNGGTVHSPTFHLRVTWPPSQAIRSVDFTKFSYPASLCDPTIGAFVVPPSRGQIAFGDLSGDGVEEAAIILTCGTDGTLFWQDVLIYKWQSAPTFVLKWAPVTAPPSDWAPEIHSLAIAAKVLTVKGTVVPPGGCHACSTDPWTSRLVLKNGHLILA